MSMDMDRRKAIQIGLIVVCLVGAVLGYWLLSREGERPEVESAARRAQEINQGATQEPSGAAPKEIERTAPRGRIPAPGGG